MYRYIGTPHLLDSISYCPTNGVHFKKPSSIAISRDASDSANLLAHLSAAQNMKMQVLYRLRAVLADIAHHTEALVKRKLSGKLCNHLEDMCDNRTVFRRNRRRAFNVDFRYDQKVYRRLRVDVVKA